jgi:hypothetical protein
VECGGVAISNPRLCSFTLPEEEGLTYTVFFETEEGKTISETFTDRFDGGNTIYLWADGFRRLEYDSAL